MTWKGAEIDFSLGATLFLFHKVWQIQTPLVVKCCVMGVTRFIFCDANELLS